MQETMKKQKRRMLRALTGRKTQLGLTDLRLGRGWSTPTAPRTAVSDVPAICQHREDGRGDWRNTKHRSHVRSTFSFSRPEAVM